MANVRNDLRKLIPAVGYIRMSTDDQTSSPERQKSEIIALAEREGYEIIRWYEDHGISGTESKNRPAFQEMMKAARNKEFPVILLYEMSRFSREDVFEAVAHWKVLLDAGIRLITVQTGEIRFDDLGGIITSIVGQYGARGESIKFAQRSMSGKRQKAKLGHQMGQPPLGFDREVFDENGNFVRRIVTTERFKRPNTWRSRLVPSEDGKVVEAIRWAYEAITKGMSTRSIMRELRERGVKSRKGNLLNQCAIQEILRNPVYMGALRFNHENRGKFTDRNEETILVPNAHVGIVSAELFNEVQAILSLNFYGSGCFVPGRYLLRGGILNCSQCGKRMVGQTLTRPGKPPFPRYRCEFVDCPKQMSICADSVEKMVLRLIIDHVLSDGNLARLQIAEAENWAAEETNPIEELQLNELRRRINRAENNLAMADSTEDFKAISKQLQKWRSQETALVKKIKGIDRQVPEAMREAMMLPKNLEHARNCLHLADRMQLRSAIVATIQRIEMGRIIDRNSFPVRQIRGTIQFNPEVLDSEVISFDENDIYPEKGYLEVAKFIQSFNKPVTITEVMKQFTIKRQLAWSLANRASLAGLLHQERRRGMPTLFSKIDE